MAINQEQTVCDANKKVPKCPICKTNVHCHAILGSQNYKCLNCKTTFPKNHHLR